MWVFGRDFAGWIYGGLIARPAYFLTGFVEVSCVNSSRYPD
jgi:hypothetical protein